MWYNHPDKLGFAEEPLSDSKFKNESYEGTILPEWRIIANNTCAARLHHQECSAEKSVYLVCF